MKADKGVPNGLSRLAALPRARLTFLPTPLIELPRLTARLGGPRLLMKRDDQTGLGLGGNKTRKLEFLLGEAVRDGADVVITGGAAQSNHCRQTAAAAAAVGLSCHLALGGTPPAQPSGNLLLDGLFGAVVHWCGDERKGERIPVIAAELRAQGRRPYVIPYGGSNAVGAMGFVAAMQELKQDLAARRLDVRRIVVPSSSGGTQAGMVVGADLFSLSVEVVGIEIDKGRTDEGSYAARLASLANEIATRLSLPARYTQASFRLESGYLGGGYGVVGDLERDAIHLLAREEGILIDPVYTGRAMGALLDFVRRGALARDETVLFWHTGGAPALFSYAADLVAR